MVPIVQATDFDQVRTYADGSGRIRSWMAMADKAYRAAAAISNSGLTTIATKSYRHYLHDKANPKVPTTAMVLGTVSHTLLLEPLEFGKRYVVQPDFGDGRTKEAKAAKAAWLADVGPEQEVIDTETFDKAQAIVASVRRHPVASQIFAAGHAELSAFWMHPVLQVWCKARLDWVTPDGYVVDFKTTSSGAGRDEWQRTMFSRERRYYCQSSWYSDAHEHVTGVRPKAFIFVVAETEPPHEVAIYTPDGEAIALGARDCLVAAARYAASLMAPADETGYPVEVQDIGPPRWMLNNY